MATRGVRSSARLGRAAPASGPPPERRAAPRDAAANALRRARALERAREVEDSPRVLREKCRRLARALRNAKHLVVYTGAGISTAADIPDYRGPHGVWTRLQRGESPPRVEVSRARPTFTHMALTALWARGTLKFVVSQNCDGLHLRAGMPRRALAELHGDMFAELCAACRAVYLRAFDTTERTARHAHATRRLCHGCGRELRDSIVHFGERGRARWPLNWAGALRHAAAADVVLCLGSSLKVLRRYPRLWCMHRPPRARPALYIVNLQWTPKDSVAALKINARCDTVMAEVARRLRLRVPRYREQRDPLLAHAEPLAPPEAHTTRRPVLRAPLPAPPHGSPHEESSGSSSPTSPSPSESDDEVPLRCLAERLRGPAAHLQAFRVNMHSGEATILLRSEHVPHAPQPTTATEDNSPARPISELRRFRISRPSRPTHPPHLADDTKPLEPKLEKVEKSECCEALEPHLLRLLACSEVKLEPPPLEPEGEARALAAAIIARAVLLCRAQLYSGLHTIIAPQPAPPPPPPAPPPPTPPAAELEPECEWCMRRYSARRCLWYGPPRLTPLERRAWRCLDSRRPRTLCACCGEGSEEDDDEEGEQPEGEERAPPAGEEVVDEGGWYGKGYRKGRRRRR